MIFTIEPSSNRIIATLPEITYQCKLSACSSPTCGCESIRVDFFPGDLEDEALSQVTPSAVKIDLATWRKNDQECLLIKSEFATEVIKNIDEDDYEFLMAQFYGMKHRCIEEADFSTLVADFPVKDVENNSQMLAYLEVIPHAKPYRVEINNQNYFVDDQYCVKPNCKCSEVYLSYFLIPQTQLEGKPGKNKEAFVYLIDYKKQTWKKVVGGNKSSTWTADDDIAKNTFESAYPDSWRLVQTRHLQLKQVYANSMKQRKQGKPAASIKKVGRNELCPCGSGKKYKKCCGTS